MQADVISPQAEQELLVSLARRRSRALMELVSELSGLGVDLIDAYLALLNNGPSPEAILCLKQLLAKADITLQRNK